MLRTALIIGLAVVPALSASAADVESEQASHWHQWRGPLANGVAPHGDPPVEWGEDKNVRWKVELPGQGTSTPIIWDNKILILTAIKTDQKPETADAENPEAEAEKAETKSADEKADDAGESRPRRRGRFGRRGGRGRFGSTQPTNIHEFVVLCLDRSTGDVLWQHTAREELPHEGHHRDHGFASGSPTTDGQLLYASFGSRGIFCYTLDGEPRWDRDLGDMRTRNGFGEGASPTLIGDKLIVNWDHEGEDFVAALDANTGETRWQVDRDEPTGWSTPLAVEYDGKTQVVVNGTNRVKAYDLESGEVLWECGGQTVNAIPSPVTANGLVFCMSGFRGSAAFAIPAGSSGDLTETEEYLWRHSGGTPYVPSPLLSGDLLYFTKGNAAVLNVLDARTGEYVIENQRLPGMRGVYASPVSASGRVYIVGRDGKAVVLREGAEFEVLAENELDDPIDASPAIVGKEMYLRGNKHLYCIAE